MSQTVRWRGPIGVAQTAHVAENEVDGAELASAAGVADAVAPGWYSAVLATNVSGIHAFWVDRDSDDVVLVSGPINLAGEDGLTDAESGGASIQVVAAAEVEISANDEIQIVIGDAAQTTIGNTSTISATVTIAEEAQTTGTCSATFKDTANTTLTNGTVTMSHVASGTWSGTVPANMAYPTNRRGKATVAFTSGANSGKRTIPVTFVERT